MTASEIPTPGRNRGHVDNLSLHSYEEIFQEILNSTKADNMLWYSGCYLCHGTEPHLGLRIYQNKKGQSEGMPLRMVVQEKLWNSSLLLNQVFGSSIEQKAFLFESWIPRYASHNPWSDGRFFFGSSHEKNRLFSGVFSLKRFVSLAKRMKLELARSPYVTRGRRIRKRR